MSYLGNAWEFEKFNLKDMWGKIKDDPERLFIGAVTPWTSKMWGKILGKDYEPIVDQMGGPYGGSTISAFGNKDGGVYARAKESGVPTKEAGNLHDAAHVIAALYAGGYGLGALGGGGAAGGAAAPSAAGSTASSAAPSVAGFMPGTAAAPMEGITVYGSSGLGMGAGTEAAMAAAGAGGATAAGNQGFDWQRMLNQSMPTGGNQQQQMQSAAPARGARPGMWDRIKGGLGKMGDNLLQIDSRAAESMSPDQLAALKRNAYLQMGLGMMAASNRGAGFGEAAAFGLGQGQTGLTNALQRDYQMAREARQEQRQQQRDEISDLRYAEQFDFEKKRAEAADARDQRNYELELASQAEARSRWENTFEANQSYRDAMLGISRQRAAAAGLGKPPSGYRWNADGSALEAIPGGPATKLTPEGAGKAALLKESERAVADAKKILFDDQNQLDRAAVASGAMGLPFSDGRLARERIKLSVESTLRLITGAAAPESEVERYTEMFTPSTMDSDEAARTKIQALERFIQDASAGLAEGRGGNSFRGATGQWSIEEVQ